MALRSAPFDNDAGQTLPIDGEQFHDRRLAGHQHDAIGLGRGIGSPPQLPQQSMEHVLHVEDALLEQRCGNSLKSGDILIERGEQGTFGGGAGVEAGEEIVFDGAILHNHELRL